MVNKSILFFLSSPYAYLEKQDNNHFRVSNKFLCSNSLRTFGTCSRFRFSFVTPDSFLPLTDARHDMNDYITDWISLKKPTLASVFGTSLNCFSLPRSRPRRMDAFAPRTEPKIPSGKLSNLNSPPNCTRASRRETGDIHRIETVHPSAPASSPL